MKTSQTDTNFPFSFINRKRNKEGWGQVGYINIYDDAPLSNTGNDPTSPSAPLQNYNESCRLVLEEFRIQSSFLTLQWETVQMAFSLSNHSLLTPRLAACFSSPKPSKNLALCQPIHHHRHCKPILGFLSLTNSSPINMNDKSRRSFKAYLSAQDSAPTVRFSFPLLFLNDS